jgi:hypothetical protein
LTEPNDCESCHFYPGNATMRETVSDWKESEHARSYKPFLANTYCAKCHSPFQADPLANSTHNDPVLLSDWEGVKCSACHPPPI